MKQIKPLPQFYCPLSGKPLTDPLMLSCTHVYDRAAITPRLGTGAGCPLCRELVGTHFNPEDVVDAIEQGYLGELQTFAQNGLVLDEPLYVESFAQNGLRMNEPVHVERGISRTPLALAVHYNRVQMVEYLLAQGADPNAQGPGPNPRYSNPLYLAAMNNSPDMLKLLINAGASTYISVNGVDIVELMINKGFLDCFQIIVESRFNQAPTTWVDPSS